MLTVNEEFLLLTAGNQAAAPTVMVVDLPKSRLGIKVAMAGGSLMELALRDRHHDFKYLPSYGERMLARVVERYRERSGVALSVERIRLVHLATALSFWPWRERGPAAPGNPRPISQWNFLSVVQMTAAAGAAFFEERTSILQSDE